MAKEEAMLRSHIIPFLKEICTIQHRMSHSSKGTLLIGKHEETQESILGAASAHKPAANIYQNVPK
jgi:hypothetical protein